MHIQVLSIPDCPHTDLALERIRAALAATGQSTQPIDRVLVATDEDAVRWNFPGSPTLLLDGEDPFTGAGIPSLACRVYRTGQGFEGFPSVDQLVAVLSGKHSGG